VLVLSSATDHDSVTGELPLVHGARHGAVRRSQAQRARHAALPLWRGPDDHVSRERRRRPPDEQRLADGHRRDARFARARLRYAGKVATRQHRM
jgi:hypothetical protein